MKQNNVIDELQIFTHRGLEPSKKGFYSESSIEAFENQLKRGFSLEVDLNFTKDGIVLCHDNSLSRITSCMDTRELKCLTTTEVRSIKLARGRLCSFEEIMNCVSKFPKQQLALHFKGVFQTEQNIHCLMEHLESYQPQLSQILLFDLVPTSARAIKSKFPSLEIAASVADAYDIERYQVAVKGTLMILSEFLEHKDLYNWAWLDEWDLASKLSDGTVDSTGKKLYSPKVFKLLKGHSIKIALVTPELHATSPGLLGGEAHPDAKTPEALFGRIEEILQLKPNAICTDYPDEARIIAHKIGFKC